MDVSVDGERRHAKRLSHDDRCRLVADPWKFFEFFKGLRNLALVLIDQDLGKFLDRFGFLGTQPTRLNDLANSLDRLPTHVMRIIRQLPQVGSDTIDHFVGALGAQDYRDEQRVRIVMIERNIRFWIEFIKTAVNDGGSLFSIHDFRNLLCGHLRRAHEILQQIGAGIATEWIEDSFGHQRHLRGPALFNPFLIQDHFFRSGLDGE